MCDRARVVLALFESGNPQSAFRAYPLSNNDIDTVQLSSRFSLNCPDDCIHTCVYCTYAGRLACGCIAVSSIEHKTSNEVECNAHSGAVAHRNKVEDEKKRESGRIRTRRARTSSAHSISPHLWISDTCHRNPNRRAHRPSRIRHQLTTGYSVTGRRIASRIYMCAHCPSQLQLAALGDLRAWRPSSSQSSVA
ncbi:hypothetical protein GY45DRAFT_407875 [Cubamyces sp. BRFM 1775]|nr:hypothetical protein GY45DRAFT_407875 [Cubamyces sp. BRFM 1775]